MTLPIYRHLVYAFKLDAAHGRRLIVPIEFKTMWEARNWLQIPTGKILARRPGYENFMAGPGRLILATPGLELVPHIPEGAVNAEIL